MPSSSKILNPDRDEFLILIQSGDNAGKWLCKLCKSKRPFAVRPTHCKSDIHRRLVAQEQKARAARERGLPLGVQPNPWSMFSEADLEGLGFKIPNREGSSVGAEVGGEQGHTVGGNPNSSDDKYSAWSDGSNFQKTLLSGYEVPDPVVVEDKVNLDMVLM
ncbi:hypothetical protein CROQUDRAFT_658805 [Cronartium quercuum f. sp. fusiforme G11]|uniref:Uncharacterized protein n=1 Tax=Cronartium quercuum f. sp. fusiforme G11 TaxID=708437 RepID=A0A9P6NGV8_9BASI|nr:hypothetical protein CROQUDRAFT_658805 [Cronartium quercuum f. sp. fusiforme G11]